MQRFYKTEEVTRKITHSQGVSNMMADFCNLTLKQNYHSSAVICVELLCYRFFYILTLRVSIGSKLIETFVKY